MNQSINEFYHPNGKSFRMWNEPGKIGRAMAAGSLYERPFLDWIYEQRFEGAALDVGANTGGHMLWMAEICGLYVVGFEPVLPHVARANAALNGSLGRNVEVRDYALGDVPSVAHHGTSTIGVPRMALARALVTPAEDGLNVAMPAVPIPRGSV